MIASLRRSPLWLLLALGCAPEAQPEPAPEPRPAAALAPLFPLEVGDRWRERLGPDASRTRGVTARTPTGLAVIFGQGDRRPAFYASTADEVALVTPDGRTLEPLLRAPVRAGEGFSYENGGSRCEVRYARTDASREVRGVALEGCVALERTCTHPAGAPFPVETRRVSEETYCPGVGRVAVRTTLSPPPSGAGTIAPVELASFRVASGPSLAPPGRFGCDDALLLPSDVQAALGPRWEWAGEEPLAEGCVHRFTGDEDALEVRFVRHADEAAARRARALGLGEGEPVTMERAEARRDAAGLRVGAVAGRVLVSVVGRGDVSAEGVGRLLPLLESLAR